MFPLLTKRKLEPISVVDETLHVNIKCCRYIRVSDAQVPQKKLYYLRPHQFQKFSIRYTPTLIQPYKTNVSF